MDAEALLSHLAARLPVAAPEDALALEPGAKDPTLLVPPGRWPEVARALRDDPALAFDFLDVVTAIDWIKQDRIDVVYHLFSYRHRHALVVRCRLPRAAPRIASVTPLWPSADWQEREQFDLLGVIFDGHPDLRRLLLPEDWAGHPMRKDHVEPASYRGMATTRPNPLALLPLGAPRPEGNKR